MIEDPTPEQVSKWRAGEFKHREDLARQRAEHKELKQLRALFNGNVPHKQRVSNSHATAPR